jgi:hypothetical protein
MHTTHLTAPPTRLINTLLALASNAITLAQQLTTHPEAYTPTDLTRDCHTLIDAAVLTLIAAAEHKHTHPPATPRH